MRKQPDPVDIHVGRRLRMRRLLLKMSQTKLGQDTGITFQQIQKYEKGTNRISSSRLEQFVRLLDVPITYFFEDQPTAFKGLKSDDQAGQEALALQAFMATKEGLALANAFQRIKSRELRRSLVNLVKNLSGEE
jgi:transcriptional regulator with XRE-family HTH domain